MMAATGRSQPDIEGIDASPSGLVKRLFALVRKSAPGRIRTYAPASGGRAGRTFTRCRDLLRRCLVVLGAPFFGTHSARGTSSLVVRLAGFLVMGWPRTWGVALTDARCSGPPGRSRWSAPRPNDLDRAGGPAKDTGGGEGDAPTATRVWRPTGDRSGREVRSRSRRSPPGAWLVRPRPELARASCQTYDAASVSRTGGGAVEPVWVTTGGGPLIVMPESACPQWGGVPATYPDEEGDYGRACAVDGYLGLIDVGGAKALVLGDYPARTTFVPAWNVFVRAIGLDADVNVEALASDLVPVARWEEALHWSVAEPVMLFDSVYSGAEFVAEEHLRLDLAAGVYTVEAAYVERPDAYVILVRLTAVTC